MKKERVCLTLLLGLNLKLIIIEINKVSNQQVMIEDLFPTLLAVAQRERSILAGHQLDSIDFRQLWCDIQCLMFNGQLYFIISTYVGLMG